MSAQDPMEALEALFDRARQLAHEVGRTLEAGRSGDGLLQALREQAEVTARFRERLAGFRPERSLRSRTELRRRIGQLQAAFEQLVKDTEANHRLAARKGVRVPGLGGKPHTSPKPSAAGRTPRDG